MLKKRAVVLVLLILVSSVFAVNSDFNNDGKVDFDDFFLFADNFQKSVNENNEKFDLDKNKRIDVEDFFIFAEDFEKGKTTKPVELKATSLGLDCNSFNGKERDYCWDLAANTESFDENLCNNINDNNLKNLCMERTCIFSKECGKKDFKAYHVKFFNYLGNFDKTDFRTHNARNLTPLGLS